MRIISLDHCIETTYDSFIPVMRTAIVLGFILIIISLEIYVRVELFSAGKCGSRSLARVFIDYSCFFGVF
jgi:hypothetical protein